MEEARAVNEKVVNVDGGIAPEPPPYNLDLIKRMLNGLAIPFSLHFEHTLETTMNIGRYCEARGLELKEGTVLLTAYQTGGIGYNRDSTWVSSWEDVKMTILVDDKQGQGIESQVLTGTALQIATLRALRETVDGLYPFGANVSETGSDRLMLKWHNDVYLDWEASTGRYARKLSGAMCPGVFDTNPGTENFRIPGKLVCGVGANVSSFAELNYQNGNSPWPISLLTMTGKHIPTDVLAGRILRFFSEELTFLRENPVQFCQKITDYLLRDRSKAIQDQPLEFTISKDGQEIRQDYHLINTDRDGFHVKERGVVLPFAEVIRIRPYGFLWARGN